MFIHSFKLLINIHSLICDFKSYVMAWVQRLRMGCSMPTAGTFVADKADARQRSMVTVVAVESLVRAWCYSIAVFSPVLFIFESGPGDVFKGENMVGCEMPGIMVLR